MPRRISTSRAGSWIRALPGTTRFGTVWLPLPHLLMLPLVRIDALWRNGLAGAIPASVCFVVAGVFLFAAMRRATFVRVGGAGGGRLVRAESESAVPAVHAHDGAGVLLARLMALLYFTVRFRETQSFAAVAGAGVASLAASLTRYEGWFLIPFVAVYFLFTARRRRIVFALVFGAIAALGPLYWLAHNWWLY